MRYKVNVNQKKQWTSLLLYKIMNEGPRLYIDLLHCDLER
jgi:hypothetical protein